MREQKERIFALEPNNQSVSIEKCCSENKNICLLQSTLWIALGYQMPSLEYGNHQTPLQANLNKIMLSSTVSYPKIMSNNEKYQGSK